MAAAKRSKAPATANVTGDGPEMVKPPPNPIRGLADLFRRVGARRSSGEARERNAITLTAAEEDAFTEAYPWLLRLRRLEAECAEQRRRMARAAMAVRRGDRALAEQLAGLPPRRPGRRKKIQPLQLACNYVKLTQTTGRVVVWDETALDAGEESAVLGADGPVAPAQALELLANHHDLKSPEACREALYDARAEIRSAMRTGKEWQGYAPRVDPSLFRMLDSGLDSVPVRFEPVFPRDRRRRKRAGSP